jgi:hypothetical protein
MRGHQRVATLLTLVLVVGVAACGGEDSDDAIVVPDGHAAIELVDLSSAEELSAAAEASGIDHVCGTFAVSSDATETSACMVSDDGVVAVIAFDSGDDMEYILSGPAIDTEVTVPVGEPDVVYGVEASPGQITLSIKTGDSVIGMVTFGA